MWYDHLPATPYIVHTLALPHLTKADDRRAGFEGHLHTGLIDQRNLKCASRWAASNAECEGPPHCTNDEGTHGEVYYFPVGAETLKHRTLSKYLKPHPVTTSEHMEPLPFV